MARKSAKKRPVARKKAAAKKPARKKAAPKAAVLEDGRPGKMWWPALAPFLTVRDGQAAIEFYARAFGFETYGEVMRGEDGSVQHAAMRLGETAIMLGPVEGAMGLVPRPAGAPDSLTLYVYVPNVDSVAERARRGGATLVQAPADQFWQDRTAVFKDPDGFHWTFATHLGG